MKRIVITSIVAIVWVGYAIAAIPAQTSIKKVGTIQQIIEEPPEFSQRNKNGEIDTEAMRYAVAKYRYQFVDTKGKQYRLPDNFDGSHYVSKPVIVSGIAADKAYLSAIDVQEAAGADTNQAREAAVTAAPFVLSGAYRIRIVLVTWNGSPDAPAPRLMSPDQLRAPFFYDLNSVNLFWQAANEAVFAKDPTKKFWLIGAPDQTGVSRPDGDVVTNVNLNININECPQKLTNEWTNMVLDAVRAQGRDPANADTTAIIYPADPKCTNQALGSIGALGTTGPDTMWVPQQDYGFTEVFAHEMGHNFGLYHTSGYQCQENQVTELSLCMRVEYAGDDIMGGLHYTLPNVYQRLKLGWINQPLREITTAMSMLDLVSPALGFAGGRGSKSFTSGQNVFVRLKGSLTGTNLYLDAKKRIPPFYVPQSEFSIIARDWRGPKLIIGADNYMDTSNRPYVIDTNPATLTTDDAALLNATYVIGNVTVTNNGRFTPRDGMRVSILF